MSKRITVLIIDDEKASRIELKYTLGLHGFDVYLAKNGRKGLAIAREKQPDLILLDWMMPGMSGLEVLSGLKYDERTEHIPVCMLTARGKIGDLELAFELGADDYITKPVDGLKLGKLLKRKLEKYTATAESN